MQKLINDFADEPLIPIPNLKIKKELYDLGNSFQSQVDQKTRQVLALNGF